MIKLEDIKKDAQVRGIQGDEVVRIVQVEPVGDAAITIYYKDSQRRRKRLETRLEEMKLVAYCHSVKNGAVATLGE